jgi:hypothetical protein
MAKYTEEQRLKVLAKLQSGTDPHDVVQEMSIPYQTIMNWKRDMKEAEATAEIHTLVKADAIMVHRIAEEVKEEMIAVAPNEEKEIIKTVDGIVESIDSYQALNTKLHATAAKLVDKISLMADDEKTLGPMGLQVLVESLARIQVAFFNKNSTNINVLNQNVVSEKQVSTFKAFNRP